MEYNGIKVLVSEGAFKEYKNEKLKDIMEYLEDPNIYVEEFDYCYKRLSLDETNILLDYITDLQEENERLKEDNYLLIDYQDMEIRYNDYKQRIDKAIEYIKKNIPYWQEWHYDGVIDTDDMNIIIDILRGDE